MSSDIVCKEAAGVKISSGLTTIMWTLVVMFGVENQTDTEIILTQAKK